MTPNRTINLLRLLFVIFTGAMGFTIGDVMAESQAVGAMYGVLLGLSLVLVDRLLSGISLRIFSSATFGLLLGVVFAQLLLTSNILKYQSEDIRWVISLIVYSAFGYMGMMLAIRSNRDEFSLIIPYVRFQQSSVQDAPILIDTNIIIDGRIGEICATGFVSGSLVIPRFVLDELQALADSADSLKRERGRRGFEIVRHLQSASSLSVTIHESTLDSSMGVDNKLLQVAKILNARLLTNDYNLCKVAEIQKIPTLNLNDLAKAMTPAIHTEDAIEIALVKEGRESHQAIGYLEDGTMIVVNHARDFIGKTTRVVIGGSLQTAAGRLYFAELKN